MKTVGIVGGGLMGMTLALRLSEKGFKVSIFESSDKVGGLASAWQIGNVTWDKFYHVILLSDSYTRKIIKEIGLEDQLEWKESKSGFYLNGSLFPMSGIFDFLRFPPLKLIDKFRLGLTIFVASKIRNWRKLEKISVEKWLIRWSGKNTFKKVWLPLLKAKLGESYKETSAAFIWATIQRMYAARRTGLKKEMFGYVAGGYANILEKLTDHLKNKGVEFYTSSPISRASRKGTIIELEFNENSTRQFDQVVLTIPSIIAAGIIDGITSEELDKLNGVQYLGVVCTSILLKNQLSPYYITNIIDKSLFTGVIEMGALVDKKFFNGYSLLYLPKYVKSGDFFYLKSDKEIEQLFLDELKRMYPEIRDVDILNVSTARAANVFALPVFNYSQTLSSMKTSVEGIFVINSSYITNSTLNVNDTVKLAEIAVDNYFHKL